MATEKRMIFAGDLWTDIMMLPHNGDMISSEEVEQAIKGKDCTFSAFIIAAVRSALEDLEK